jgi:hypothetical protein
MHHRITTTQVIESAVSIRRARPDDTAHIQWIAQRDTRPVPPSPLLVAEVDGRVLAVRSLATGESVADPFRPTAHLTAMLALRALGLATPQRQRRTLARWRRRGYAHA